MFNFKMGTMDSSRDMNASNEKSKCININQVKLMAEMQDVWKKHVWWTREVIIGIADSSPGLNNSVTKLLKNPAEMAADFAPYYDATIVRRITELFTEHLKTGGDIFTAMKARDMQKIEDLTRKWYANADDIAKFYASFNPYYSESEVRKMMYEHLRLTLSESAYIMQGRYDEAINAFDMIQDEAAQMADYFAAGIVKQFPERFYN